MHASEYLNSARKSGRIINVALLDLRDKDKCVGRAEALVLDKEARIAVLLSDVGFAETTNLKAGDLIEFAGHPEAEFRIVSGDTVRANARLGRTPPGGAFLVPVEE